MDAAHFVNLMYNIKQIRKTGTLTMKKINLSLFGAENFDSSRLLSYFFFFAVAIVMTAIVSFKYYANQQFFENGVSKKDIYAKKTIEVVDTRRTELIKNDVAEKIRPIMTPVEDNYIRNNLKGLLENIEKIRDNQNLGYDAKTKELHTLLDIHDSPNGHFLIKYILDSKDEDFKETLSDTSDVLDELLKIGISENEFQHGKTEEFIRLAIGESVKKSQIKPISGILEHVIVPNLIVDKYATELARKNAKAGVKPYIVTFKKGDSILKKGEPVTQLKKAALEKAGYNLLALNKGGILGVFLLICLTNAVLIFYMKKYEKQFAEKRYLAILATLTVILTVCATLMSASRSEFIELSYLIPIPAYTILIAIFTSPQIAFLATILLLGLFSLMLGFNQVLMVIFMFSTLMASYSVAKINYSKRMDLIKCGIEIGLMGFCATFLIALFELQFDIFSDFDALKNAALMFVNCVVSGIIALGVLPILENLFKVVTPYALIELADHNSPLLAKLQYKAPGTYHHSLMAANLCEAAAEAIGANPILARVGAFYHDIGKLKRPLFFIENQSYFGIENPHSSLNPRLSKMIITSHTKEGVELAKEYGLPQAIINFIQQHHGEGLAGHFYNQAVQLEGAENLDIDQFRYPGPKPQSKEAAILMLADAVESAVRSLKSPSQEEIENMINKIITERLNDGQLSDSSLTLKDIKLIATTFNRILRGMQHDRIKYHENILSELEKRDQIRLTPDKAESDARRIAKKLEENKEKDDQ